MDWRLISAVTEASARFGVSAPGFDALWPADAASSAGRAVSLSVRIVRVTVFGRAPAEPRRAARRHHGRAHRTREAGSSQEVGTARPAGDARPAAPRLARLVRGGS